MSKWFSREVKRLSLFPIVLAVALSVVFSVVFSSALTSVAVAQETETKVSKLKFVPLGMFISGGVDRTLTDIQEMFKTVGRPDMYEVVEHFIGENMKGLKGIDRERAAGYFLYLGASLPPSVQFLAFVPVDDEEEFLYGFQAATDANLVPKEVGPNHFEFGMVNESDDSRIETGISLLFHDGYALIFQGEKRFNEIYEAPDIPALVSKYSTRYDLSAVLNIQGISPIMREVFISFLNQQVSAALQQRDGESDAEFMARSSSGLSSMESLQMFIRDGEEICFGIDSNSTGKKVVVELTMVGKPNTPLLKNLKREVGRPSQFSPVLTSELPLQAVATMQLDEREQKMFGGLVESLRLHLKSEIQAPKDKNLLSGLDGILEVIKANFEKGEFESLFQVMPGSGSTYVLVNAYKVNTGFETLNGKIHEVLNYLKTLEGDAGWAVDINSHTHQGVTFSRVSNSTVDDAKSFFGDIPSLYVGTGRGMVWLGLGGANTQNRLDECLDTMSSGPAGANNSPPLQVLLRASKWLNAIENDPDSKPEDLELMKESLNPGVDTLKFEVRPVDNGARMTLTLDEGFIHLLGSIISKEFDKNTL